MKKINRTNPTVGGICIGGWWSFLFLLYGCSFSLNIPWYGWLIGVFISGAIGGIASMKWLQSVSLNARGGSRIITKLKYADFRRE